MQIITRDQARAEGKVRYFTGKPCKYGHLTERYTGDTACVECARQRSADHLMKDPDKSRKACVESEKRLKLTNHSLWQAKRKIWRQKVKEKHGPIKYMFSIVRDRAKRGGLEFTITRDDIIIPSTCPMLGIPLFNTPGRKTDNTPSLDRIDNTQGYIPGNIQVISERANRIKNNATIEELEKIVNYLKNLSQRTIL